MSAICARIESPRRWGEAGYFHALRKDARRGRPRAGRRTVELLVPRAEFLGLARMWQRALTEREADDLAGKLGVGALSLRRLGLGWNGSEWTFPMHDAAGAICGVQRRRFDGKKLAVKGSRMGIFLPTELDPSERLFVLEGASDTAAFLDLGLAALGRPSCTGGARIITRFVRAHRVQEVVVVADADGPGRSGARGLVAQLQVVCRSVRLIEPGCGAKDARAWVNAGATRAAVLSAVEVVEPLQIAITVRRRGQR